MNQLSMKIVSNDSAGAASSRQRGLYRVLTKPECIRSRKESERERHRQRVNPKLNPERERERQTQKARETGKSMGTSKRHCRREALQKQGLQHPKQLSGAFAMLLPANRRYLKAKSDASLSSGGLQEDQLSSLCMLQLVFGLCECDGASHPKSSSSRVASVLFTKPEARARKRSMAMACLTLISRLAFLPSLR